jgi:hypothetical protein
MHMGKESTMSYNRLYDVLSTPLAALRLRSGLLFVSAR